MEGPQDQPTEAAALEAAARERYLAGDIEGAAAMLRRAIELDPNLPHLYANLGVALATLGRTDEAIPILEKALSHQPGWAQVRTNLAQAYVNRANALLSARRFAEAAPLFQRALALWPGHDWALNNLAVALQELGRLEEALGVCGEAVGRHPEFAEAHYNLGRIYQDLDRHAEAVEAFQRALVLRPDYAQAQNNLAISLHALGRVEEAVREYECAIDSDPAYDDPRVNLGMALRDAGRLDEAVAHYRGLLGVRPDLTEARWNLGHILLLKGDWEEGFEMAEARRQIPRLLCNRTFARPEWRGEDPGGRTILLHAEQGFGDSIQFFRYARLVRRRGARVILLCQGGLKRLLEGQSGVDEVVAEGDPLPDFDLHCPLLTLPVIFRTTPATVPHDVPYIDANPSLVARWASRMEPLGRARRIGLAWAGNPRQADDRTRSMPADALEPLARVRNARFISLQKPRPMKGIVPASLDLIDFTDELSDFADTAAVMQNLDLIVTVDTSVSHLAGALGRPVWTMLSKTADWRYLLGREDSPWYPTMRLFRQTERGEWWKVVERIAGELE